MSATGLLLYLFFAFLTITIFIISSASWGARYRWVTLSNYSFEIFNQKNEIKDIAFIIKEYKYKYFLGFIFYGVLNYLFFFTFLFLAIFIKNIFNFGTSILFLLIPIIIVFLFSNILFFIILKKYVKELNKIGFHSKKEAITNFLKFQLELEIEKVTKFTVVKNKNRNIQDMRFQFQQRHHYKKIKKIINKKDYDVKLLNTFIKYLQIYGFFLNRVNKSKEIEQYEIFIEDTQNYKHLNELNKILINNFFAYARELQKDTKN